VLDRTGSLPVSFPVHSIYRIVSYRIGYLRRLCSASITGHSHRQTDKVYFPIEAMYRERITLHVGLCSKFVRNMYMRTNMLTRRFKRCSVNVTVSISGLIAYACMAYLSGHIRMLALCLN